jgi:hypothetical protein
MTGLFVGGDSRSWLNNGYAIGSIAARLDRSLAGASSGATSAERAWYGPASQAFLAAWSSQYTSYEDLLGLIRRAANAIDAYGQALEESQRRARVLEYTWCAAGLIVGPDGCMALPHGAAALPPEARLPLEGALTEANRDVGYLGNTTAEAVVALTIALNPVIALLDEFGMPGFLETFSREVAHNFIDELKDGRADAIDAMHIALDATKKISTDEELQGYSELYGKAVAYAGFAWTLGKVGSEAQSRGYLRASEDHAGDLVDTFPPVRTAFLAGGVWAAEGIGTALVGAGVVASAPVAVVAIGGLVLGTVVALGVGAVVQTVVDHNRAKINHIVHDIGSIF